MTMRGGCRRAHRLDGANRRYTAAPGKDDRIHQIALFIVIKRTPVNTAYLTTPFCPIALQTFCVLPIALFYSSVLRMMSASVRARWKFAGVMLFSA